MLSENELCAAEIVWLLLIHASRSNFDLSSRLGSFGLDYAARSFLARVGLETCMEWALVGSVHYLSFCTWVI